ncbi:MAG: hypothetical protein JW716_03185 [Candidatus Aenigmarchaeota archaeon]|nr:hypothetical protein [Candidatus Aenigmarchaeota archaeon]
MKKMKGITPIISIIILLLITIALAATAYSYLSGYLFGQISGSFSIPANGAFCSGGTISVIVRNDAPDGNLTYSDLTIVEIDGAQPPSSGITNELNLAPGQSGRLLQVPNQVTGNHEVVIGTGSNIIRQNVYCP